MVHANVANSREHSTYFLDFSIVSSTIVAHLAAFIVSEVADKVAGASGGQGRILARTGSSTPGSYHEPISDPRMFSGQGRT